MSLDEYGSERIPTLDQVALDIATKAISQPGILPLGFARIWQTALTANALNPAADTLRLLVSALYTADQPRAAYLRGIMESSGIQFEEDQN